MNPYYTHRPYLTSELNKLIEFKQSSAISILELGVGDGSSQVFNEFAKNYNNISIIGLDTNFSWCDSMRMKYGCPNYQILHLKNWNESSYFDILNNNYDLVFVDQSPWKARIDTIDMLYKNNNGNVIILHDYDYYNDPSFRFSIGQDSFFCKYLDKYNISEFHITSSSNINNEK
jgi:trans-aconitate methyltransferase